MQVSDGLSAEPYEKNLEDTCQAKIGSQRYSSMQEMERRIFGGTSSAVSGKINDTCAPYRRNKASELVRVWNPQTNEVVLRIHLVVFDHQSSQSLE